MRTPNVVPSLALSWRGACWIMFALLLFLATIATHFLAVVVSQRDEIRSTSLK